jgi:hypothetical protein
MDETTRLDELLDIENRSEVALYHEGNLVLIDTREARFFEAWKAMPDAIVDASQVRTITKGAYCREIYYRDWMKQETIGLAKGVQLPPLYDMCRIEPSKDYRLEGLWALTELFAKETEDCIQFRFFKPSDLTKHPEGHFSIGDKVCTFDDWEKGYLLARMRFGETKAGRSSSKKILGKYSGRIEFVEKYTKEAKAPQRRTYRRIRVLKAFAFLWDVFFIPLRYFSPESALEFSREYLEYSGNDLPTFCRVFLEGGGGPRDGNGLMLSPAKPYVITKWKPKGITINSEAAIHHGFDVNKLSEALSKYFERQVYR